MRILGRRYTWRVSQTRTCTRYSIPAGRGGVRGSTRMVRSCQEYYTSPSTMLAADGERIPFPSRYRRGEAYETADSVVVDIYLDVDTSGYDNPEDAVELGQEGEIDFSSIEYDYIVLITIRQPSSLNPLSAADFVPAPTPISVATTMLTPTEMGHEGGYSRRLRNGIVAMYYVHW